MVIKHTHHLLQIIFAVLIGYLLITRLFISWVQYAPDSFIGSVEWVTESQIEFEHIEVQQNWLGFQFQLQRLAVQDEAFDLTIQHLDMDINLFSVLIPTLKYGDYLTIENGVYHDKKTKTTPFNVDLDGLSGVDVEQLTAINLDISQFWQRIRVSNVLLKSVFDPALTINVYDYQSLKSTQWSVISEFGLAYKGHLNFERFGFKSNFNTNLLGKVEEGDFSLFSFQPLRVEAIAQLLPLEWYEKLPKGELTIDLQGQVEQSSFSKLKLNLYAQSLKWPKVQKASPKHLGLELLWESERQQNHIKDWRFSLSKIQLDNQYIKAVSPIELRFEENQLLMFQTDDFDIEPFKEMFKSLVNNQKIAVFDKMSGLVIKNVKGQFNWQTFNLPQLEMTIKQLIIPATDFPGIELHDLTLSKTLDKIFFKTEQPIILSGLHLPKGGVKIELSHNIQLTHSLTEGVWALTPLNLVVDKMPLTLKASGTMQGKVDVDLKVKVGTMSKFKPYLPYEAFSPELQSWLKMALVDGKNIQAHMQLKGLLKDFPFQDGSGVFKVTASVDEAVLKFDSKWPALEHFTGHIEFTPYQLNITSPRIYVGADTYADAVEVVITNLDQKNAALVFKGKVNTQLTHAMSYLRVSPLAKLLSMEDFIQSTQFKGVVDVVLDRVWIPLLDGDDELNTKVSGHVLFKNASMTLFDTLPIENIQGKLAFTERGVNAPKLAAKAFNHASVFSVTTQAKNKTILIAGKGEFLSDKNPFFKAPLPWDLAVKIPFSHSKSSSIDSDIDVQLDVNVSKAQSLLPAPFHSKALENKTLNLKVDLAKETLFIHAILPELLTLESHWKIQNNQYQMQKLSVLLGEWSQKNMNNEREKSYIQGYLGEVNLDDWMTFSTHLPLERLQQASESSLQWDTSFIQVQTLIFRENSYPNMRVEWLQRPQKTALQIKSKDVLANVVIKPDTPLEVNVERLRLHSIEPTKSAVQAAKLCQSEYTPTTLWPEVIFKGKNLELNGYLVDTLNFHLLDRDTHLTITDLQGGFGQKVGRFTGQYLFDKSSNKSSLTLSLRSRKVVEMLRFIQLKQGFTGKKAKIKANLFWHGAPECFSIKSATGQLNFELTEGAIDNIEPGFARLIGLLSIESLARRLQLNVKDVTNKGMVYDQIKGQAQLKEGILELESFGLKAPSASVALFGQVNLLTETFELKAYVTPAIGATIPTIAALAGYANPLAALAVYTFMKVIPNVNENLVTFRYNVTGPWTDPQVSEVKSKAGQIKPLFDVEESILDTQQ
ncbi:hypothetical protein MNBD_GAMMA03-2014 [hydrothermal vent metagenome]|uniref:YhdP central domain-containing protein n=1 Tax=hydrothermal vent metagenome TaxID=652676 RepID=A0A3B0W880_9ZZZZ